MKTIHEIKAAFGEAGAGIANRYRGTLDEIAHTRTVEEVGGFWDRLASEERSRLLLEHKVERASAEHARALEGYTGVLEGYRADLEERTGYLTPRLFKVEDARAGADAARASDEDLAKMLDYAIRAQNADLAKAVFVAADMRGAGDLMARYFDEVDPEARDLYAEWSEIPPAEVLERQAENVETIIPPPEQTSLTPPARVAS